MHALAWEMRSRVARAEKDLTGADRCIDRAVAVLDRFGIPVAAWQVHSSAWSLYEDRDREKAGRHRARAKELIMEIADSFDHDEPLRESLLTAPPVRRVLVKASKGSAYGSQH
jgi:hypothetical protein